MIDQEIQARMDAFRGNPQALMQRYAQNQQLVDLLALQKLKSEKEAAARQIQMQLGQSQMPTVAQQREQELMGMAKQEVAQRVGQVGQQQLKQQQENLQRAAQTGIAQAPAPNMMPAQAMASGGIVAFAEGDLVSGMPDWVQDAPDWLKSRWQDASEKGDFRALKAIKQRAEQLKVSPTAPTVKRTDFSGGVPPEAAPPPAKQVAGALPASGGVIADKDLGLAGLKPGPRPTGAPQVQGVAQVAKPQVAQPQPADLKGNLETYLSGPLSRDPAAAQAAARAEYEKDYAPLLQEQRALQQEGIAQLRERMAQQQARQDPLTAFLLGAQGRTIGEVLGAAGRAGVGYQAEQAAAQAALQDQLQKLREAEMSGRIGQVEKAREAGETRRKEAVTSAEKAAQVAGPYLSRTDVDAVRSQLNEARMTLMQQGLDNRRIDAAMDTADRKVKMLNDRWKTLEAEKVKPAIATNAAELAKVESEQARIKEEIQNTPSEMLRLFSVSVPEYKTKPTSSAAPSTGAKTIPFSQLKSAGK